MENFENWNKKVRKKNLNDNSNSNENTNLNQRDYDKEPIIIKSYEQFFVSNLFFYSLFLAVITSIFVLKMPIINFDFNDKGFLTMFCFCVILFLNIIISFYIHTIKHKYEIHLVNNSVDFYKDGELQRKCLHKDVRDNICKRFWVNNFIKSSNKTITGLYLICLCGLLYVINGWILFFSFYLSNLIFKFFFHIIFQGKIQDFRFLPFIIIDYPQYHSDLLSGGAMEISGKNYLIYVNSMQNYMDIKEYFLQTSNINIDLIKKHYF